MSKAAARVECRGSWGGGSVVMVGCCGVGGCERGKNRIGHRTSYILCSLAHNLQHDGTTPRRWEYLADTLAPHAHSHIPFSHTRSGTPSRTYRLSAPLVSSLTAKRRREHLESVGCVFASPSRSSGRSLTARSAERYRTQPTHLIPPKLPEPRTSLSLHSWQPLRPQARHGCFGHPLHHVRAFPPVLRKPNIFRILRHFA